MQRDEQLLPLTKASDLELTQNDSTSSYPSYYDDESTGERSLREYFVIILKRLPLILGLTIVSTALMAFYMYRQPSIYQAVARMNIEPRKPKPQSKDAININFGADQNYYSTQLKLLQNPDLMKEVVIRLGLYRDPNLLGTPRRGLFTSLRTIFSGSESATTRESSLPILSDGSTSGSTTDLAALGAEERARVEAYAGTLLGGLSVEQVERTNLVDVRVISTQPELAAKVADTVATVFIEQDVKRETMGAQKTLEDLSKSIEDLRTTIAQQDAERLNYMRSSGLPLREGKGNDLLAQRLQTISGQWLTAIDDLRTLEAKYDAAQRASAKGQGYTIPDVADSRVVQDARRLSIERRQKLEDQIQQLDQKISELTQKRENLRARYTDEYVEVKSISAEIKKAEDYRDKLREETSAKIQNESTSLERSATNEVLNGLRAQVEAGRRRESELRVAYLREAQSANQQGQAETQLTTLTREIETNRSLLDTYVQRQKEQELAITSSRPDNIAIASAAQVPGGPIGPNRPRNIIVAFLVSLAAGIGLAFLLDYLDDSIRTPDDVGRHLGLPTLAMIPHQNASARKTGLLLGKNGGSAVQGSTALISLEDHRSPMAEAYRHLRTSLLFSSAGKPPQTILVTSSQPSEGKTTTAINTAITLAQAGADVVIIDCDLRRPRIHSHFGVDNTNGVTNFLSGDKHAENLLKTYADLPKLKVITSGPIPPNPAELLGSNEMKTLLTFLKSNFKHVVIDSPPAISFTDAAILATLVDGVVLVSMAGKSSIHLMRRFKQRLQNIGARIYGVVINGIKPSSLDYSYYGYGYGYGYTYSYYGSQEEQAAEELLDEEESTVKTLNR